MSVRTAILAANQAIEDNADYRSSGSLSKAVLFLEAIETLLVLRAESQSRGGSTTEEMRFNHNALMRLRKDVEAYVGKQRAVSRSQLAHLRFRCYRD